MAAGARAGAERIGRDLETTARRKDGETLTYRTAEIYHWRGDKVSARWAFSDDTEAIVRFFG